MIAALETNDESLYSAYRRMIREFTGTVAILAKCGRYPLMGVGNLTTHDLFTEHAHSIISPTGLAGVIIPTSIMTGAQTAPFVAAVLDANELGAFYDFENSKGIFPGVHSSYRFGVLQMTGSNRPAAQVRMAFHLTGAVELSADRIIGLGSADLARINSNTKNLPVFASPTDARLTAQIHAQNPVLHELRVSNGNPWNANLGSAFQMSHEAHLFSSVDDLVALGAIFDGFAWTDGARRWLPLHEGKHVWHYDHRFATAAGASSDKTRTVTSKEHQVSNYEIETRHYVIEHEVDHKLDHRTGAGWLMGWRGIASPTNQRTLVVSVFARSAVGHSMPLIILPTAPSSASVLAALCSLVCDYVIRQKQSGPNVMKFHVNQAPVPLPGRFTDPVSWQADESLEDWLRPYLLELTYTSNSLIPWARDMAEHGPPYRWDPARRAHLQSELDAAMFHVYGLDRPDTEHVLSTFRALRDAENRAYGEYRTERLVLDAHDRMAAAIASGGTGWVSLLDVPAGKGSRHPG